MKSRIILSTVIAILTGSNLAHAEEANETILVIGKASGYNAKQSYTATKTQTPILDIPQSINVITRQQLDDQAHHSIADVLRYTAGITIGQGEGNRDQITIRGQNTSADFFIDGVRDDVQYYRNLYNIERVEVLKGPYALIFGRGGGGGIINRVQKSPIANKSFIGSDLSINSFGNISAGIDINNSINSSSAFRINGFYEKLENHRKYFSGERFAINPNIAFNINEKWVGNISYEYVDDDRVTDRGIPSFNQKPLKQQKKTFFGNPDINNTQLKANIAKLRIDGDIAQNIKSTTTLLYGNYDKIYTNIYANDAASAIDGIVPLAGYTDPTKRDNYLLQSNLVWNFNLGKTSNQLLFGLEAGNQKTKNQRKNAILSNSSLDLKNIIFPSATFPSLNRNTESEVKFSSFYIQNQAELNQYLDLILGLRSDNFSIEGFDFQSIPARHFARSDNEISPRIGLVFKPNDNGRVYLSYSKSFLPRSGDQFTTLSITQENLAPEEFTNYELGVKWDLGNNLTFTTALFQLTKSNATTPDPANPNTSINVGKTSSKGFEASLIGQISKAWSINAGYTYQDVHLEGNDDVKLAQVPKNQFTLWNKYDVSKQLGLGIGYIHQSSQYSAIKTSNNITSLPAFDRFDAAIFYNFKNNIEAQLNIENIFNTDYFSDAHNNNNISVGAPINTRLTLSKKF